MQQVRDRSGLHDLVTVHAAGRCLDTDPPSVRRATLNRLLDVQASATAAAMARYTPHEADRLPTQPAPPPGLVFAEEAAARTWLEDERADLLRAVGHAVRHPTLHDRPLHVVRMSQLLFRFLDLNGWYDDAERLHGWAVAAAVEPDDRARALNTWGITAWSAGRLDEAQQRLSAALDVYTETDDVAGMGRVLGNLGGVSLHLGDAVEAIRHGYAALAVARRTGSPAAEAVAHNNLGTAHESREEHPLALEHHRAALSLNTDLGDRFGQARSLGNIADILLCTDEHEEARRLQTRCLELSREIGYHQGVCDSLNHLATLASYAGDHAAAIAGHEEALALAEQHDLPTEVIRTSLAASRERAGASRS